MSAGFSEWELILGAAFAHTWDELKNLESFEGDLDIFLENLGDNPMAWDDPKDKAAIKLGIRLYRSSPRVLTAEDVMSQVHLSPISLGSRRYGP